MTAKKRELDFQPMKMHKNIVILCLQKHPEDLDQIFPGGPFATTDEAIATLRADPHEWFVDGKLCE